MTEPSVNFQYPDDGEDAPADRTAAIKLTEFLTALALSSRTKESSDLKVHVGLELIRGGISLPEVAALHKVTVKRVRQIMEEISAYEVSRRAHK